MTIAAALAAVVTAYGVAGALSSLLQRRRMRKRGSSQDVSLAYLSVVAGGYALWLAYGLAIGNIPLIVVDVVGGGAILATLCVAVRLRHGWTSCLRALRTPLRGGRAGGIGLPPRSVLGDRRPRTHRPSRRSARSTGHRRAAGRRSARVPG